MTTRVMVTGATGFTGAYVVRGLLEFGARVTCFVRSTSSRSGLPLADIKLVEGDLSDAGSLTSALSDVDELVNVASLGFGHAPNIVNAAVAAGIRRAVFVSTTAVETTLNASTKSVRLAAEETIRGSGLAFTILRPTMIYGSARDRNMCRLIRYLDRWPVIPVFGDGKSLQQPAYVGDVARAIVQALSSANAVGRTYNISGAAPLSYNEVIDTICQLMDRRVRKINLSQRPIVAALRTCEQFGVRLPVKSEQIQRLNEDKAFDYQPAAQDFGYCPLSFREGITLELGEMGLLRGV